MWTNTTVRVECLLAKPATLVSYVSLSTRRKKDDIDLAATANMGSVARSLGIARTTVSSVLNGRAESLRISAKTQKKVLDAAARLGYRPNTAAMATRSGRFGCVALLLSTSGNHSTLATGLLDAVCEKLEERGYHLAIARLSDQELTDSKVFPKVLRQLMADGLLIKYDAGIPARMRQLINHFRLPSIWINSKQKTDCVRPDDFAATYAATERLIALGHRRIAYANYHYDAKRAAAHYSVVDRKLGYDKAMTAAKLSSDFRHCVDLPIEERFQYSRDWLAKAGADRPTAVVTYGAEAFSIVHAAELAGLSVPRDLSAIGCGESETTMDLRPVSMMVVPQPDLGRRALELLLAKLERPKDSQAAACLILPFALASMHTINVVRTI